MGRIRAKLADLIVEELKRHFDSAEIQESDIFAFKGWNGSGCYKWEAAPQVSRNGRTFKLTVGCFDTMTQCVTMGSLSASFDQLGHCVMDPVSPEPARSKGGE